MSSQSNVEKAPHYGYRNTTSTVWKVDKYIGRETLKKEQMGMSIQLVHYLSL